MASVDKMKEIVNKSLKAFSQGDWSTYRSLLTDGAIMDEEPTGRHLKGVDDVTRNAESWLKAFPDCVGRIKEAIGSGDAIVAEVEWTGTHKGSLSAAFGTIPATGKQARVPAVLVCRFDGEKIREMRHYFDLLSLLKQLGVSPQLGAGAPR